MMTNRIFNNTTLISVLLSILPQIGLAQTQQIKIVGMTFDPPLALVEVGKPITWTNTTSMSHSVTLDPTVAANPMNIMMPDGAPRFNSGRLSPGSTYEQTFTVPGWYKYVCKPHESMGHIGELVVVTAAPVGTVYSWAAALGFEPAQINVNAGTLVRWVNIGPSEIAITSDESKLSDPTLVNRPAGALPFSSPALLKGQVFEGQFDSPGSYKIALLTGDGTIKSQVIEVTAP